MEQIGIISKEEIQASLKDRFTPEVYEKISKGKAAIAGLGGLGSNIAMMLARTGIGRLLLVDYDSVDISNLNRQNYSIRHLGRPKTEALKEQILEVNPYIEVETRFEKVEENSIIEIFKDYDIVCEAFDKSEEKAMLINGLLEHFPYTKIVSGSGMAGFDSANTIQTKRRLKNLYLCGDEKKGIEDGYALAAPRVQVCAGHQANMIVRLVQGLEEE